MLASFRIQHCHKVWSMLQTYKVDPANLRNLVAVVNWSKTMIRTYKEDLPHIAIQVIPWEEYNRLHDPVAHKKKEIAKQIEARRKRTKLLQQIEEMEPDSLPNSPHPSPPHAKRPRLDVQFHIPADLHSPSQPLTDPPTSPRHIMDLSTRARAEATAIEQLTQQLMQTPKCVLQEPLS